MGIRVDAETRRKLLALAGEPASPPTPAPPRRARAARGLVAPALALEVTVPLRTWGLNGQHGHWTRRHERTREAKGSWAALVRCLKLEPLGDAFRRGAESCPVRVTLTRLGPRLMDRDNCIGGLKPLVDAVAEFLSIDDGDAARVRWDYGQQVSAEYGVRVKIETGVPSS